MFERYITYEIEQGDCFTLNLVRRSLIAYDPLTHFSISSLNRSRVFVSKIILSSTHVAVNRYGNENHGLRDFLEAATFCYKKV